jgi:hypothetical protein
MKDERPEILLNERSSLWSHPSKSEAQREWEERQDALNKWCRLHGITRTQPSFGFEDPYSEIESENMRYN